MSLSKLWELVMDREAYRAIVLGVAKRWTRLSWTGVPVFWCVPKSASAPMASGGSGIMSFSSDCKKQRTMTYSIYTSTDHFISYIIIFIFCQKLHKDTPISFSFYAWRDWGSEFQYFSRLLSDRVETQILKRLDPGLLHWSMNFSTKTLMHCRQGKEKHLFVLF